MLPCADEDARRLVARSPVASSLAAADEGGAATEALEALLVRVAAVVDAVPELVDLVANPTIVGPTGVALTEVRVRVAPSPVVDLPPVRRL